MPRQQKKAAQKFVWLILVNPTAGGGKSLKLLPKIEKTLLSEGIDFVTFIAPSKNEFLKKLKEAPKYLGIAIVGGDSALLLALQNLQNRKVRVAFIPTGSQNDLARGLGLTNYLAIAKAMQKRPMKIDDFYIEANKNKSLIAGQVNFGLGVQVNQRVENFKKKHILFYQWQFLLGFWAIIITVLKKKSPLYMKIKSHDFFVEGFFHIALFTKIKFWAGGFLFAPEASLTDGKINLILVKKCSLFKLLLIILFSYWGKHLLFKEVISHKSGYYFIEFQKPHLAQMDGEIWPVVAKKYKIICRKNGYLIQAKAD